MKKQTQPHRGGKWEKMGGGIKECFTQFNMDEIIAACDRFLADREPNFTANEAKRKEKACGRNYRSGELI